MTANDAMLTLAGLAQEQLLVFLVVFARIGSVAMFLPPIGEASLPNRIKLALGLVMAVIVMPSVAVRITDGPLPPLPALLAAETLTGLAIGILLRLAVVALQVCGTIIGQATSLSQMMGAAGLDPLPAVGHILALGGLALAMMSQMHVHLAEALIRSYGQIPLGAVLNAGTALAIVVERVQALFGLALSLAAPFLIVGLLYNLALGVINRAMPQLMVVLIGAPAITGATLALLAVVSPILLQVWLTAFNRTVSAPLGGF